jgi:hypothetical protein
LRRSGSGWNFYELFTITAAVGRIAKIFVRSVAAMTQPLGLYLYTQKHYVGKKKKMTP